MGKEEIGPYLGQFLHPPVPYDDASEYLERNREEGKNFYFYVFDINAVGPARTFGPIDYLITGPTCEYFRPAGMEILDDLLCDKIIESKSKRFLEEEDPLYETWADDLEVDYDSIIFLTIEDDHNCFFWKEGGVNIIQEDESVLFYEDENIPLDQFSSEEVEFIREGFTLIERRETPLKGMSNFHDFMEEITLQ